MVDLIRRRLTHCTSQSDFETSYADVPPRTPSPTSTEFQAYHEQEQRRSVQEEGTILTAALLSDSASSQSNRNHAPRSFPAVNVELREIEQHFHIPSYDETITRDQQLVSAATRMSVSPPSVPAHGVRSQSQSNEQNGISTNEGSNSNKQRRNKNLLKVLGLTFLNARQHLALAVCRDFVLIPPLFHAFSCFKTAYFLDHSNPTTSYDGILEQMATPGSSEHFIAGIWCLVAAYLSFAVIDGLMVRWIVTYQTSAAILRVLSMSLLLITIEQLTLAIFSPGGSYSLHTWILISCILTGAYIIQNFVTSNLDLKNENKARSVDYYNITVYAVVPVGLASFVSMIGLLRALLILRLDIENRELGTDKIARWIF